MSDSIQQNLRSGVSDLGIDLPEYVIDQLINYLKLLEQWNSSYNLTAVRDINEMVSKHLLDSLAVLPYIENDNLIDVGTGAGLPGIPLALARPEQSITLLDSNGKKTRFLTQAKIKLGLSRVQIVNSRVEDHHFEGGYDQVISRAYAATDDFIASTQHLHHSATRLLVMQGKLEQTFSSERHQLAATHELSIPGLDAERHLLEIVSADVTSS